MTLPRRLRRVARFLAEFCAVTALLFGAARQDAPLPQRTARPPKPFNARCVPRRAWLVLPRAYSGNPPLRYGGTLR